MLNRSIRYRSLLRIVGALFLLLLWALYQALSISTSPVYENGNTFWRYQIEVSVTETLYSIAWYGVLLFVAVGVLLLAVSSRHVTLAYGSIQRAIWHGGVSLWYQTNPVYDPFPLNPFWIIVTGICSLSLLALDIPVVRLLRKVEGAQAQNRALPVQTHEE